MYNENLSQHQNFNQKDFYDILIREITIKKSSQKFVKQFLKNLQQSNLCIYEVCENTKKQQQEEINISANLVQGQHKDTLKNTDEMHKTIRKITHFTFQDNQSSQYTKNNHIECSDLESKIRFTKEEWNIQIFEELNINSHLSQNFKNNQDQIFQELQKKRYYLLDKLNLSQNEEVFEGYQPSEQISSNGVCSLYYFVVIHDLNEKDFNQKMQKTVQLKVNNVNFLVHQIEVTQSTKILVLQRQYEFYVYNQVIDFLPQDFRVCWNKQLFNFLNQELDQHFKNDTEKALLNSYKDVENYIIQALQQQNYYLMRYINKGGEGIVFDGYREFPPRVFTDFIFKIYLDRKQSEIEEEINIMKLFEFKGNVIKLIDNIRLINSDINILVLEKCQFSLLDQLQMFSKQKSYPFLMLIQMIFDLLDGLMQFRIYKIVHLDIKPSNILVSPSGNYIYTDFGVSIVKQQNKDTPISGLTQKYASPEQKLGNPKIDYKSDTYSLGKTFKDAINIYKQINQSKNEFVDYFEKVVDEKMIQENCENREDCIKIHELLILKLIELNYQEFLQTYLKKIETFQDLYLYGQNKDITYFLDLNLYYHLIGLGILKDNYYKNIDKDSDYLQNQLKDIASQHNKVGLCYQNLSKYKLAIKYLLKSLEIRQLIFYGNHPEIAQSLNDVGNCYILMEDGQESLKFLLECLQMRKQLFITNNQDLAITLNNLGNAYASIGECQISLKYQLESLLMIRSVFKGDHKYISSSLNDCGNSYMQLYNYEKGFIKYNQSLKMNTNLFKQIHPNIGMSNYNIGSYYFRLYDYESSLKYYQKCLEIYQNIFGNQHYMIALTLYQIGRIYYLFGFLDKALKNFEESYQIALKVYDENHIFLTKFMYQICLINYDYFDKIEGEKQIKSTIDKITQQIKIKSNDYQLLDILGDLFYNLREYENSLKFYNQSLEIKQKIYSKFSIDIAFTLGNIGQIYCKFNSLKKCLKYSLESLEIAKQVYKNNNPEIIDFYLQVGEIKRHFSKNDDVQIYYLKALELVRKKYNQSKYLIAVILFKIGFEFKDYNQGELSLQYFLESLEEFKTLFKESNINIANNLFQIGTVYFQYQDFKNALKYFLEYRDMRQQLNYIQYDDYYFQSLEFIVKCYQFINDPILAYKTSLENFQLSKKYNRNKDEIEKSLYLFVKNCNEIENYKQALLFRIESLEQNQFYEKNLLRIGNLYELLGDFSISIEYYKQIIINLDYIQQQFVVKELDSEESGDENELAREIYLEGFWNLGLCYKQMNLHKKSLKYFQKLYNLIKDKNITKEYLKQILNEIIYCFQKLQDEKSSQFYIKKLRQSEQKDSFLLRDLVEIRDLLEKEQFF